MLRLWHSQSGNRARTEPRKAISAEKNPMKSWLSVPGSDGTPLLSSDASFRRLASVRKQVSCFVRGDGCPLQRRPASGTASTRDWSNFGAPFSLQRRCGTLCGCMKEEPQQCFKDFTPPPLFCAVSLAFLRMYMVYQ